MNYMVAPLYKFETNLVKSEGRPGNSSTRTKCLWSVEGNSPFKIQVAENDVLYVGVGVFHTKPKVRNRAVAKALCSEPFLF